MNETTWTPDFVARGGSQKPTDVLRAQADQLEDEIAKREAVERAALKAERRYKRAVRRRTDQYERARNVLLAITEDEMAADANRVEAARILIEYGSPEA